MSGFIIVGSGGAMATSRRRPGLFFGFRIGRGIAATVFPTRHAAEQAIKQTRDWMDGSPDRLEMRTVRLVPPHTPAKRKEKA